MLSLAKKKFESTLIKANAGTPNPKYFNINFTFYTNFIKIIISVTAMSLVLYFLINFFEDKLIYANYYKSFYLIMIVSIGATMYLLSARLLGVFKIKNFKTN